MNGRLVRALRGADERLFRKNLSFYRRAVEDQVAGPWVSLLDVGCGIHAPISSLTSAKIALTVGIDGHGPTIAERQVHGQYDRYECVEALEVVDYFGPKSFDLVLAMDVIEHFTKEDGADLLDKLECVARCRVIIFTPNGFLPQPATSDNPLQLHQSGWRTEELEERGYCVIGVNGWKPLRGERWEPRVRPAQLGHRLSAASQPFVTRRPRYAYQLLATLDLPMNSDSHDPG